MLCDSKGAAPTPRCAGSPVPVRDNAHMHAITRVRRRMRARAQGRAPDALVAGDRGATGPLGALPGTRSGGACATPWWPAIGAAGRGACVRRGACATHAGRGAHRKPWCAICLGSA